MAGNFNNYEDRAAYPRGSSYPEGRLTVQDVVDEALRHGTACTPSLVTHSSGSATPGGSMRHSYDCGCRDGAWGYGAGNRELEPNALSELLRRDHLQIDQINRTISSKSVWREVHPKVKHDGTYPKEFTVPRTVEDFKGLDISVLDRLLTAYGLADTSSSSDQRKNRQDARNRKLWRLFEYLGADHLTPPRHEDDPHHSKHERYSGW